MDSRRSKRSQKKKRFPLPRIDLSKQTVPPATPEKPLSELQNQPKPEQAIARPEPKPSPKPVRKTTVQRGGVRGFRIKDEVEKTSEGKPIVDPTNLPKEAFVLDDVLPFWKNFQRHIEEGNHASLSAVLNRQEPKLLPDHKLQITVQNESQIEKTLQEAESFLEPLKKKVNNFSITLDFVIEELDDEKRTIFTVDDKYAYLAKKNPAVIELRKRLGLDPIQ